MLVVAIIGLLAAIAIPKFANLVIKAKEAAIRGELGSLRSAVSIYYADNEGRYPFSFSTINAILIPKYMNQINSISIPTVPSHGAGNAISNVPPGVTDVPLLMPDGYIVYSYSPVSGQIVVNCTHTDSKGTTWTEW
jgi:type II secretory pathway pseudopilin PulG